MQFVWYRSPSSEKELSTGITMIYPHKFIKKAIAGAKVQLAFLAIKSNILTISTQKAER